MQLDAPDLLNSRKRPRSISRDSESGESSPKRAASEGPSLASEAVLRSPGSVEPQPFSNLSIIEDTADTDVYMATQDGFIQPPQTWPQYPGSMKISTYDQLATTPLVLGEMWYMVSAEWLKCWRMACRGERDKAGIRTEATLGPVDNASLVDHGGYLRSGLLDTQDYEVVPRPLWERLEEWYGPASHVLQRKVSSSLSLSGDLFVECYVPRLKVYRLCKGSGTSITGQGQPHVIDISFSALAKDFLIELTQRFNTPTSNLRCWRAICCGDINEGSEYPVGRLKANQGEVLEIDETDDKKTLNDLLVNQTDEFAVEIRQNGQWLYESSDTSVTVNGSAFHPLPALLSVSQPVETTSTGRLFSGNGGFFGDLSKRLSTSASSSASSALQPAASITSQQSKSPQNTRTPGTLGLSNLGNTCFMNSAIQCLAHNEELTEYFLTNLYREELNRENPLGMGGAIAETFGSLLSKIWASSGPSTYAPRDFKQQLQRFAPQFSGYQQHDSQELVAFLLDGLHEDLNRVRKKPYVENPDWEGGGDQELIALARKSWEGYISRNDSVIVDLFQGQYKSTLVCPECQKVSITFDPFMYLTLPLPIKKKWRQEIYFIPWDVEKQQLKIPVEVDNDTSFRDLKRLLAGWTNSQTGNLIMLEVFTHRFYKLLDDNLPVSEMTSSDYLVCYELPCQLNLNEKTQTTPEQRIIFPVYCTATKVRAYSTDLFGHPFFVALTEEETYSLDAVYAAIVDRLRRWTVNASNLYKYVGAEPLPESRVVSVIDSKHDAPVTEIRVNGDIIEAHDDEADITDVKTVELVEDEDMDADMIEVNSEPVRIGPQSDMFTIQAAHFTSLRSCLESSAWPNKPLVSWEERQKYPERPILLPGDVLYCKWEENMQAFFFGDEHALWTKKHFEEFIHPELEAQRKQQENKKSNIVTIEDCLDEFTREEQLGEEDPWYCPRCKKHQQATKNLQLWKVPDVLVVHLKRFSNSRIMRDKLDAFIDFPLDGLDLENRVGERQSARSLATQGHDPVELGLRDLEEPLLYDLFAVDEHMGGLGGGHYRAYARNYPDNEWYHFDDSHVTKCQPSEAVNRNAYLLFYRRRTTRPIGGKTYEKIQAARQSTNENTLLTPSDENVPLPENELFVGPTFSRYNASNNGWHANARPVDSMSSTSSSPPALEDDDGPPGLEPGYEHFSMPGSFASYRVGATSPVSVSSNKAEGGSESGGDFSDTIEATPYSKGRLKPATFDSAIYDDSDPSWGDDGEPPLSRAMSEAEDSKVIEPSLLDDSLRSWQEGAPSSSRQLPSPEPEEPNS